MSNRENFMTAVRNEYGDIDVISRQQVKALVAKTGVKHPTWLTKDADRRAGRGLYSLKETVSVKVTAPAPVATPVAAAASPAAIDLYVPTGEMSLIPEKAQGYVPFGHFSDLRSIIKSRKFYPVYVTGLSGNGKTMMAEQICAAEKREFVRANITIETDEDDLLGGFRLVEGQTVFQPGPVTIAMERGALLLLDEVDLGSNKLMCLQPVLEGKPIYLKKVNKVIHPAPGFNIIATANTKGKGSDDGRFIGTNVMNEAFLERFAITMEQEYPSQATEKKILNNVLSASNIEDTDFTERLTLWADSIRKAFYDGAVADIISTRRLVNICEAYVIFGQNRLKALDLCLSRFDTDTKSAFIDLYEKLDETVDQNDNGFSDANTSTDEVPF